MNRRNFLHTSGATLLGGLVGSRVAPALTPAPYSSNSGAARLTVFFNRPRRNISQMLYGQFTEHLGRCIYDGIWVGPDSSIPNQDGIRKDSVNLLRSVQTPLIRWPGGCFADTYHWRDGIGPRAQRPKARNIWWGRDESNEFGTDEFLDFCRQTNSNPYICLNVGSGSPEEAMEWMQYCNANDTTVSSLRRKNGHADPYNVRYWSVGNESWGCGGNYDPEVYADEFIRFMTFLGRAAADRGDKDRFVACGNSFGDWNQKMFDRMASRNGGNSIRDIHYLSIHYYSDTRWDGLEFSDSDYYNLLGSVDGMDRAITRTADILDYYAPAGHKVHIGMDEWGAWHHARHNPGSDLLLQDNTFADAILAAAILNLLSNRSDLVHMATLAQTFNVIQCMALTNGPKFAVTPTAYVFGMFRPHMDADGLDVIVESPEFSYTTPPNGGRSAQPDEHQRPSLSASASVSKSGDRLNLILVNQHLNDTLPLTIDLAGIDTAFGARTATLSEIRNSGVRTENNLDQPNNIHPPVSRPVQIAGAKFTLELPPHSIQSLSIPLKG